jgi:hypothetical protein
MAIFLTNPTTQNWEFHYRTPTDNLLAMVEIRSGRQVEIGKKWSPEQTEKVITQLQRHGAREATDFNGLIRKFSGLMYRVGERIESDEILDANSVVKDSLQQRSVDEAVKAAAGFDRAAQGATPGVRRRPARVTGVEVTQQLQPHEHATGDEVKFSMTVDPEAGTSNIKLPA